MVSLPFLHGSCASRGLFIREIVKTASSLHISLLSCSPAHDDVSCTFVELLYYIPGYAFYDVVEIHSTFRHSTTTAPKATAVYSRRTVALDVRSNSPSEEAKRACCIVHSKHMTFVVNVKLRQL